MGAAAGCGGSVAVRSADPAVASPPEKQLGFSMNPYDIPYSLHDELRSILEEVLDRKFDEFSAHLRAELFRDPEAHGSRTPDTAVPLQGLPRSEKGSFVEDQATLHAAPVTPDFRGAKTWKSFQPTDTDDAEQDICEGVVKQFQAIGSGSFYDTAKAFSVICGRHKNTINARDLMRMQSRHSTGRMHLREGGSRKALPKRFADAIYAINTQIAAGGPAAGPRPPRDSMKTEGSLSPENSTQPAVFTSENATISTSLGERGTITGDQREITLDTFTVIMGRRPVLEGFDVQVTDTIHIMRDILVQEETFRKVAQATHMSTKDLTQHSAMRSFTTFGNRMLKYLDPFIGFVILLNAVVVLVSTDVERDSDIWDWFEIAFTIIFVLELTVKIMVMGCRRFFMGPDMCWNVFDLGVVLFATVDIIFSRMLYDNFTLLRFFRFARLTKLIRVLKLRAFAELVMLVNGVLVGFRTLLWVVIFLILLLLSLGVVLTETVGRAEGGSAWCDMHVGDGEFCRESLEHLDKHRLTLFGNVFRSAFTTFRCLTEDCSSVDGTPLVPRFLFSVGPGFVVAYMLVFIFVTFGLFNLVMAVFVETTINGAKRADIRRKEAQLDEHVKTAQKLQQLIVMFHKGQAASDAELLRTQWHPILNWIAESFQTRSQPPVEEEIKHIQITQQAFYDVCDRPEARRLLEELDIDFNSRRAIFDVLDANGNGSLEITELVQGLLRLRGVGDRADMVASLLAIRAMQRSLKALEAMGLHQQKSIRRISNQLAASQERRYSMGSTLGEL